MTDDDDLADKYLAGRRGASTARRAGVVRGLQLGARRREPAAGTTCGYWTGGDWWGVGPGAHGHVGGVRWWNVKHPTAYAERIGDGLSPAHAREVLDAETRRVERVLLETRLREGLPVDVLDDAGRAALPDLVGRGLVEPDGRGRVVLTTRGRLLADAVVRDLL